MSAHQPGSRVLLALVLAALLIVVAGAGDLRAQPIAPSVVAQGDLPPAFTFHGQLVKNSLPYNGLCTFTFGLWDAAAAGTQLGVSQDLAGVAVSNGVFSVILNEAGQFGPDAFSGASRWLGSQVRCVGDLQAVDLGRQQLTAAPYALAVSAGAGNSLVSAINNGATGAKIAANRLADNLVRMNPSAPQHSSWEWDDPLIDIEGGHDWINGGTHTFHFRLDNAGGLVITNTLGFGWLPASGAGTRLMWYPYKAAFRAGGAAGNEWDDANLGFYSWAGGSNAKASGNWSFAYGQDTEASGSHSVAMGLGSRATGPYSVALGRSNTAGGTGAVALGYHANTAGKAGALVFSDGSSTTDFVAIANNEFAVRASGGVRLRTSADASTGCNLPAGTGAFTCTSDRNEKENFQPMDGEAVLARLSSLPVDSWNFKADALKTRHAGPMAQDFYAAFGLGVDDKSIASTDLDAVNMLAIQALAQRTETIQELQSRVTSLEAANAAQEGRIDALEARLSALEHPASRASVGAQPGLPWAGAWPFWGGLGLVGVIVGRRFSGSRR